MASGNTGAPKPTIIFKKCWLLLIVFENPHLCYVFVISWDMVQSQFSISIAGTFLEPFWGCFHILWSWIPVFECVPCSLVTYLNTVTNQKQHWLTNLVIIQWFFNKSVMWKLILKPSCKLGSLVLAPWNHLNIKWMDLIQHAEFVLTNVDWLLQKKTFHYPLLVKHCTMKILGDPCDRNDIWHVCLKSKKKFTCFAKKNCKEILVLNSNTIFMCIFLLS